MHPLASRLRTCQFWEGSQKIIGNRNCNALLSSIFQSGTNYDTLLTSSISKHHPQQQIRHYYPNYYGASKARPKLTYSIDEAVGLLRQQCNDNPNSTVSIQITMNLDWRIKTQRLLGLFDMPYSSGKLLSIAAATLDLDLAKEALKVGANHAGDLTSRMLSNEVQWPNHFDVLICTTELAHEMVGKSKLARKLRRHKITPTVETKTLVESEELIETVRKYAHGFYVPYKSDLHGNIGTRLARFVQPDANIVENFHYVLRHIFDTQLTQFGNGPDAKKKNIGKYILGIHIVASQGDSYNLNLDTIDICRELNQQTIPFGPRQRWKMTKIKN